LALYQLVASLEREDLDFAAAAKWLEEAVELAPRGDHAPQTALKAAFDRWAAGDWQRAEIDLRLLRGSSAYGVQRPRLSAFADELYRVIVAQQSGGPRWVVWQHRSGRRRYPRPIFDQGAYGAAQLVAWLFDERQATERLSRLPSFPRGAGGLAELRFLLERASASCTRVMLDEKRIQQIFDEGGVLMLEEHGSAGTRLLWVRGFEPVGGMLLVVEPSWAGPLIRPISSQRSRSALTGCGALVVWGVGSQGQQIKERTVAAGVDSSAVLEIIDRCQLDSEGRRPPLARVAHLAREGRRLAPDLAQLYRYQGLALLEQVEASGGAFVADFERWLADVRTRFADAGWANQLHARALQAQGRHEEACIAWSGAQRGDDLDPRNLAGHARALAQMGRPRKARMLFRRAVTLAPRAVEAWVELARVNMGLGHLDEAERVLELAREIDAEHADAAALAAELSERRNLPAQIVQKRFEQALGARQEPRLARRLMRCYAHQGAWNAAWQRATASTKLFAEQKGAWLDAIWMAWSRADAARTIELGLSGMQRIGPDGALGARLMRVLIELLPAQAVEQAARRVVDLLISDPEQIKPVALVLADAGFAELALSITERAQRAFGEDVNAFWHAAQVLIRLGEDAPAGALERSLMQTCQVAPHFAYGRAMLAIAQLKVGNPGQAMRILEGAPVQQAPGLMWTLIGQLMEMAGQKERAQQARQQLTESYPDSVLDHARFMRQLGLSDLLAQMLYAMLGFFAAQPAHARLDDKTRWRALVELGRAENASGRHEQSLEALLAADELTVADCAQVSARCIPYRVAIDSAIRLRRYELAAELARRGVRRALADTSLDVDIWVYRGVLAACELLEGYQDARASLLQQAPRHPGAWANALRIERVEKLDVEQEDLMRLKAVAPGIARLLRLGKAVDEELEA
jgi:tetratricopeptide (TPR) repeat protein